MPVRILSGSRSVEEARHEWRRDAPPSPLQKVGRDSRGKREGRDQRDGEDPAVTEQGETDGSEKRAGRVEDVARLAGVETESLQALQELWKKEQVELQKRGLRTLSQSPEASKRFIAGARTASLARMKERMEKAGGTENYDKVVQLFTPE